MSASEFFLFFNQVAVWPKSVAEMDLVADQIGKFLGVQFVIFLPSHKTEVGVKFLAPEPAETMNREGIASFVRDQLKQMEEKSFPIHRASLVRRGLYWPVSSSIQHLTFYELKDRGSNLAYNWGLIVLGSEQVLQPDQDVKLISLAQRLVDLARIHELELAVQIRNQFLSIASHELKTPLTSIYGILQLQERQLRVKKEGQVFKEQEQHYHFLKMVIRQVERLNELIDGLLDVSRIQNDRFRVEPTDTDVAALLNDCAQSRLGLIAQEAGVRLNVESIPKLVCRVDPVRMEEVINNLIMNAIRFSPEGGMVWIRLRDEGGGVRLTVRDQGPSIPIEDRERIFHPFEQAQRSSRMGGLGLGLFISRQIAQLHGGNVSLVESIPGKGNVFEAYFPTAPAECTQA